MGDMPIKVPENFGATIRFGSLSVKDMVIFVMVFLVFVAVATIIPNIIVQVFIILFGFIFSLIFAFRKIDYLDMYQYMALKLTKRGESPTLGVSTLKIYGDDMIYNGSDYFMIVKVSNGVALDYMSDDAKLQVLTIYEQMLNACDFPLQFIVKTRKVREDVFDRTIKEESKLAEGYRNLLHQFTRELYLQFYYIVIPVRFWEMRGATTEMAKVRRAREILNVRVGIVLDYLAMLKLNANVVRGKANIYEVIKGGLR